jgi:peptidoglycan-N-acetylglucosamine deacetylase
MIVLQNAAAATRNIWLTFDDGPHPSVTERILQKLEKFNISATFFVVGRNARRLESLVQEAFAAGHRIGNHSYTHADLTKMTMVEIREEIQRTDDIISKYSQGEKIFRPPFGLHNAMVERVAVQLGYRMLLWNVDTLDWDKNFQPDRWIEHGLKQIRLRNNSKVLNHDICSTTADNLEAFIGRMKQLQNVMFKAASTL